MKSIILQPTWKGIMPLLLEVAINGETAEGRENAKEEILRCAEVADEYIAKEREEQETAICTCGNEFVPEIKMRAMGGEGREPIIICPKCDRYFQKVEERWLHQGRELEIKEGSKQ